MTQRFSIFTRVSLSAFAISAVLSGGVFIASQLVPISAAYAQDHDDGGDSHDGGKRGPQAGKSGSGHEDGHDDDGHDEGHDDGHESGKKGGGHGETDQGGGKQGSHAGGEDKGRGQAGSAGGKPVWAQEGIPEVELGRLNVIRSPEQVLDRAEAEALAVLQGNPSLVAFYNQPLSEMIMTLSTEWDSTSIIDSPLQNLALFEATLKGSATLSSVGVTNASETLQAVFLGVASDKNIEISTNTVLAVTQIMGTSLTPAQAASIATKAEQVRIAVLAGHG